MMTPSRDLAFASDDELEGHDGPFSTIKLQMNPEVLLSDEEGTEDGASVIMDTTSGITKNTTNGDQIKSGPVEKSRPILSLNVSKGLGNEEMATMSTDVPRISITPMTPQSASLSPDGQSTVSLNSSGGSPLFQNQKYRGRMAMSPNLYWRPQSPMPPRNDTEAKDFFAYRDSIVTHVTEEVEGLLSESEDGCLKGTWLLTEIDFWDNEKERIILLCDRSILIVKYDFIAMKQEDYRRIQLTVIDKIVQGELKYPDRSIAPRLNGIAGGLHGLVKDCLIPKVTDTMVTVGQVMLPRRSVSKDSQNASNGPLPEEFESQTSPTLSDHGGMGLTSSKTSLMSALALENFEPRTRNVQGIRIMWNQDSPLTFTQKWNPFNKSIPWITFASHPLLWHKGGGGGKSSFDIESFGRDLIDVLSTGDSSPMCRVEYKPIIIETYVGIASLFHNANSLGFYKYGNGEGWKQVTLGKTGFEAIQKNCQESFLRSFLNFGRKGACDLEQFRSKMSNSHDREILGHIFNPLLPLSGDVVPDDDVEDELIQQETYDEVTEKAGLLEAQGVVAAEAGNYEEAVELFTRGIETAPNRASGYNNRAQVYRLLGNIQHAKIDLNNAINMSNGKGRAGCQAFCQRGLLYLRENRTEDAKADFDIAAKLGSAFAKAQLVQLNPYAALCNKMLRDVMGKLQCGESDYYDASDKYENSRTKT